MDPVSSLLDRPGSVEPPAMNESAPVSDISSTYLDLPVELPMLAPELPVLRDPALRMERKHSLFGIFENEEVSETTDQEHQLKVRKDSRIDRIPVTSAIACLDKYALTDNAENVERFTKFHSSASFLKSIEAMFADSICPSKTVIDELFMTISGGAGQIPLNAVCCAIVLLAKGSRDDKIGAIFEIADIDKDGSLSFEELYEFFRLIFENVMTRSVLGVLNANGVPMDSSDQLAAATAKECIDMCDLDRNGCLSLDEFRKWFEAPRQRPRLISSPFTTYNS